VRVEIVTDDESVVDEMQPGPTEVRNTIGRQPVVATQSPDHAGMRHHEYGGPTCGRTQQLERGLGRALHDLLDRLESGWSAVLLEETGPVAADLIRGQALPFTGVRLPPTVVDEGRLKIEMSGDDPRRLSGSGQLARHHSGEVEIGVDEREGRAPSLVAPEVAEIDICAALPLRASVPEALSVTKNEE